MASQVKEYLVSYDIACRKRWRRVFRLLQGYGEWVQLSVFRCRLDTRRHARLVAELSETIEAGEDRLLIALLEEEHLSTMKTLGVKPEASGRALVL